MLCANCGAQVPLPDSRSATCSHCGKSPLDIGDWGQIKKLRKRK
jgi:hypothetical protein